MNDFAAETGTEAMPAPVPARPPSPVDLLLDTAAAPTERCSAPLDANSIRPSEGRLALTIFQLGKALAYGAESLLPESGIDGRSYWIMAALEAANASSQLELAELCDIGPGTLVGELDRLEDAGYVERHRDPNDRRRSIVELTDSGRTALKSADTIADELISRLLSGLTTAQRAQLLTLLRQGMGGSIAPR